MSESEPDFIKVPSYDLDINLPSGWIVLKPNPSKKGRHKKKPTKMEECLNKLTEFDKAMEIGMENNPWDVDDASEFLRYHCPECEFNSKAIKKFSRHSIDNHEKAKYLFRKLKKQKLNQSEVLEDITDLNQSCQPLSKSFRTNQETPKQSFKVYDMTDDERIAYINRVLKGESMPQGPPQKVI